MTQVLRRDVYNPVPTDINKVAVSNSTGTQKYLKDGEVLIQKENETYSVSGTRR